MGRDKSHLKNTVIDVAKIACLVVALGMLMRLAFWGMSSKSATFQKSMLRLHEKSFGYLIPFYAVTFAASIWLLVITPFVNRTWLRLGLVGLIAVSISVEVVSLQITAQPFRAMWLAIAWQERGVVGATAGGYLPIIASPLIVIFVGAVVFALKGRMAIGHHHAVAALSAALVSGYAAAYLRDIGYVTPVVSAWTKTLDASWHRPVYRGEKAAVAAPSKPAPHVKNIVLIVDESVRGDVLEVNGGWANTTPYLLSRTGPEVINFGVAASMANCSAPSRLFLRTGARERDFPDGKMVGDLQKRATIWQYAAHAGFSSWYVDGFGYAPPGHSLMMATERKWINKIDVVGDKPTIGRDTRIADEVVPRIVASAGPTFAFIEKYGTHFPYAAAFPATLPSRVPLKAGADDMTDAAALKANYALAVRWSVDEFLSRVLPQFNLHDTVVIYTADHGQSLLEGGYKSSHCTAFVDRDSHPGEALVPLFVFTADPALQTRFAAVAQANRNRISHFEVFPTILRLMGYDASWVRENFGQSLLEQGERGKRRFLTYAHSGHQRWNPVDK